METFMGILIPFIGTTLGSACVFFMKKSLSNMVQRSLAGFAAGVMVAASIWSLLFPAKVWEGCPFSLRLSAFGLVYYFYSCLTT